jgi:undecaprenyl-diphosphatase
MYMILDSAIFHAFYSFATSVAYLEWIYIFLASYLPYLIVAAFLYELVKISDAKKKIYIFLLSILAVVVSRGIVAYAFDFFLHRAPPFVALGISPLISQGATYSFPSGHMSFLIPIGLASFLIDRRLGIWLSSSVFIVGLARIAVGVHWPSDILGGILIGAVTYLLVYKLLPNPEGESVKLKTKSAK